MKVIETTDFELEGDYSVAIGKFDGIHKGHQKLIDTIMKYKSEGLKTAVFTFEPSPIAFFGNGEYKGLTTRDEKRFIFEKLKVDVLVEYPLNKESAAVSPQDFVKEILIEKMHTKVIACGADFTFGDKGKGNIELLQSMGHSLGFETVVCDKVQSDGKEISSTLIRKEVENGDMEQVSEHIGAYYSITGKVVKGNQIGRTIGLPTVNIVPDDNKLLPPFGVYEAQVSYRGKKYKGITNVGVKPTVTNDNKVVVETHILDFDQDLYGTIITVNLIRKVRAEKKFASVDELKEQIESDILFVREGRLF